MNDKVLLVYNALAVTRSGRSFMYIRNRIGPRPETKGIPNVNGTKSDSSPSKTLLTMNGYPKGLDLAKCLSSHPVLMKFQKEFGMIRFIKGL